MPDTPDSRRAVIAPGLALLTIVVALALAGCGGDDNSAGPGAETSASGPVHVHGLGINPGNRALFIATHEGLFRAPPSGDTSKRVGDRYQDTMGFTVLDEDHFLGSGHPDPREQLPPLLGLIESRDGGKTWRPLSLLGEADFHVLEAQGSTVYGYDASGGRFMASRDGGTDWSERMAPEPLVDVAIDPRDDQTLVTAGQGSLYASRNGGRRWRRLRAGSGYLAWPAHGDLYLTAPDGAVRRSADGGRTWREAGTVGAQPAALDAARPRELYVALHDGTIQVSVDGGKSWRVRSRP